LFSPPIVFTFKGGANLSDQPCQIETDQKVIYIKISIAASSKWGRRISRFTLVPRNRGRRFAAHFIGDPVNASHFVDEATRNFFEQRIRQLCPVGRHDVADLNVAKSDPERPGSRRRFDGSQALTASMVAQFPDRVQRLGTD
jgi:hypothetical protein